MTVRDFIDIMRHRLHNFEKPFFWTDFEFISYCNDTITEFAKRTLVYRDRITSSVCDIFTKSGQMFYDLHESVIYVYRAEIRDSEILILPAPALWNVGDTVTGADSGVTCTIISVDSMFNYTIGARTGSFGEDEILSNGTSAVSSKGTLTALRSGSVLSQFPADIKWGARVSPTLGRPQRFIYGLVEGKLMFDPTPDDKYVINLTVSRIPDKIKNDNLSEQVVPVNEKYLEVIMNGVAYRAYIKPGENTYNKELAQACLSLYTEGIIRARATEMLAASVSTIVQPHGAFI